ncbi:tRNA-dihydrouridine synthase A [Glaciecola sp. KUL10]|nr:tRNA-dihydrouridine synthase A [Glaciecola sp. KUL10]
MVTTGAIIYGKGDYLAFNEQEHPVVLQLGGSDPVAMAECAKIAQERGYDEVNINVGCPSDRVKNGSFGACLMSQPHIVAKCVRAMQDVVDIPVTVKCRIGIDDMDEYADFEHFVSTVADSGCAHFIVHARKAWLKGLSPKENRDIPPLNYPRVYQLKEQHPMLKVSINGGVKTVEHTLEHLTLVDGVMMGREVYSNPCILNEVENRVYQNTTALNRADVVQKMVSYTEQQIEQGARAWHIARHMLGLFQGQAGGRIWRRYLSENGTQKDTKATLLLDALAQVLEAQTKAQEYQSSRPNL